MTMKYVSNLACLSNELLDYFELLHVLMDNKWNIFLIPLEKN
jgi:hypothetical protein